MTITIHIDPTQVVDEIAVLAVIDKDYGDYVKVIEVCTSLEKYSLVLKKLCADQLIKKHGRPPEDLSTDFMKKCDEITMADIFPIPQHPKKY